MASKVIAYTFLCNFIYNNNAQRDFIHPGKYETVSQACCHCH